MPSFQEARDALVRTLRAVWPDAKPVPGWVGIEAWGAPRPEAVVDDNAPGTYDPTLTVVGIADRKTGPTVYLLDPGDYFVLDTHRDLLEGAGLKLGRSCIMHTRKGPLPTPALEELFRRVKARDAQATRGGKKAARKAAARKAPAKAAAKKAPKTLAGKATSRRMGTDAAASVDEYLARLPKEPRAALERLRKQIRAAAPQATEKISYGMPTFAHEGTLVHMAAFRDHLSFFPGSGGVTLALRSHLDGFETAKGTIRFTPDKPLPAALVKRIVEMRLAENAARAEARRKTPAKKAARKAQAAKRPAKQGAARKKAPARR